MNEVVLQPHTQDIVVDEVFPHAPETIWKTLTSGALISRWMMVATGFEPVEGNRFTFQTTPAGEWDGVIPLPGAGGETERAVRLRLERRARGQCRLWLAS